MTTTAKGVTPEMVEAACKGYWPDHWPKHFAEQDTASIRRHMRSALDAALSEIRAELERRKEWSDAIISLCKALGSDDMPWGGDKTGWGFIFYFVKHLHTRAAAAESQLEMARKALERAAIIIKEDRNTTFHCGTVRGDPATMDAPTREAIADYDAVLAEIARALADGETK